MEVMELANGETAQIATLPCQLSNLKNKSAAREACGAHEF
jgi:hypothetical protein